MQIDSATFQAAVTAAVKNVMVQPNANNASRGEGNVGDTNRSNNQERHRVSTNVNASDHKPKGKKRKFQGKKKQNLSQKPANDNNPWLPL